MFKDSESVELTDSMMLSENLNAIDVNSSTHEIVQADAPQSPLVFVAGALAYDGAWSVLDQDAYDKFAPIAQAKELAEVRAEAKALKARISDARDVAMYTDISLPFPVEEKTIQFRNVTDRQNLESKVLGATVLFSTGAGATEMRFTCEDNSIVLMTATELMSAGLAALASKDALFYAYKALKDAADAAETPGDLALIEADLAAL